MPTARIPLTLFRQTTLSIIALNMSSLCLSDLINVLSLSLLPSPFLYSSLLVDYLEGFRCPFRADVCSLSLSLFSMCPYGLSLLVCPLDGTLCPHRDGEWPLPLPLSLCPSPSLYLSLMAIALGKSSRWYSVSAQSWWMFSFSLLLSLSVPISYRSWYVL